MATLDLQSRRVDLVDFAGFLGGTPVRTNTAGITPEQREDARKAEAAPKLLPEKPIKVPRKPEAIVANAIFLLGSPRIRPETKSALLSFARAAMSDANEDWKRDQYPPLVLNAVRQLLAVSPDMQTS